MNLEEKLYTSTEVAEILGVSLRSVYRYLDEGKLSAEVKTATGRHRFTKQNILDFLYPTDDKRNVIQEKPVKESFQNKSKYDEIKEDIQKQYVERKRITETDKPYVEPAQPQDIPEPEPVKTTVETEEEPIDWLEKFRAAANKYREEEVKKDNDVVISGIGNDIYEKQTPTAPAKVSDQVYYYRSLTGGLKDIAQNIDKSARKALVDYAFTMNAGLSLHKPIKPFSVLHAYIRPEDREFFERMLHLVPSEEGNAQLCLINSEKEEIFSNKQELHGLYVVANPQLRDDLAKYGEEELVKELDSVIRA